MIQNFVTFVGDSGRRVAKIGLLENCMDGPCYVAYLDDELNDLHFVRFFNHEEEAERVAQDYAFEGLLKEIK